MKVNARGWRQTGLLILKSLLLFVSISFLTYSNLFSESAIPKVSHSVKPLNLSRPPTVNEIMAAGQLGGQLYPTADMDRPVIHISGFQHATSTPMFITSDTETTENETINLAFGKAIQEWNKHNYKNAVTLFRKHVEDFPDSPWVSEAKLHIGCDAKYNGRYTEAEDQFKWIIENNRGKSHEGAKRLMTKAMLRLGVLKVLQNNLKNATEIFVSLKKESLDWRERTYASNWIQRISRYKSQKSAMLKCGTEALAYLMDKEGKKIEAYEIATLAPDNENGHSISDLVDIAASYKYEVAGYRLSISELNLIPLPAIMQIAGKSSGDKGHYWVLDSIENGNLELYDPQSRRRFTQSPDEFSKEWTGKVLVSASRTVNNPPGEMLSFSEMKESYGGCCGVPRPEESLGNPQDNAGGPRNEQCPEGAPVWNVNMVNMNLYVTDIPIWYTPPIGPSVRIQLSYNSQSSIEQYEPFGNKWTFSYGSYLVIDTGGNVTVFMSDGRRDVYTPDGQGNYIRPFGVFNTLTWIANNYFELAFPDGTVYVYNIPQNTNSLQPFLVEIRDAYNQKLSFGYIEYGNSVHLRTVTDALNKVTNFIDSNYDGLIDRVDDPFGRSAYFEYDANGSLTKITDMGGYWTELSYDADIYLTRIKNEKSIWDFYIEPADGLSSDAYPAPGSNMFENYRITITNPLGKKEEYYYFGGFGYESWYISPRDYVTYTDPDNNNFTAAQKTYYYLTILNQKGKIQSIQFPEGGIINYWYDFATGKPLTITDYHIHINEYTYNANGLVTSYKDARGNITTYVYYPNNIDVKEIRYNLAGTPQDDDILLNTFTYNGNTHDLASVTDRLNIVTELTFNSFGQLSAITQAKNTSVQMTTEMVYDDALTHELAEIKRNGNTISSFTQDNIGRIQTQTDATGLTLTYDYSNLDQITKILYPDTVYNGSAPVSQFVSINYSTCCPRVIDSITDRAGLTTNYVYNAARHLIKEQGPQGIIKYGYDANGNLTKLTDADGKITSFEYNLDNRLVKRIYPDDKFVTYEYDLAGLLAKTTNSRNIDIDYTYDGNHNLLDINYSDTTHNVAFTYDDYDRLTTMTDDTGLYQYTYDDIGRLLSIDGPWTNDTITYQYDELNQLKSLTPQLGQAVTYKYDYDSGYADPDLGRLKAVQLGSNAYTYGYTGINPLIQSLTRPNGSITEYLYNDPLKRLTEITNKTSADAIINKHVFTYNNLDLIETETITTGTSLDSFTEGLKTYNYNNLNQLLDSTNPNQSFSYDDDGNMTQGYTPEGYQFTATYDAENRLKSIEYTDSGSIVHKTEYYYSGDSMLAHVKKFENSILVNDTRFVKTGFLPIQERDGSNSLTREYTWGLNLGGGIGGLLNLKQSGSNYSYLYDGKGNISALIDNNQTLVASYRYDVFGKPLKKTGTLDQPYRFSTKQYDEPLGHYNYGYRFYSPSTGRWLTRDPLGETGGINLYNFVGNNPVNFVDPHGLFETTPSMSSTWTNYGKYGGNWLARQPSPDIDIHGTVQAGGSFHVGMIGLGAYSGLGIDTEGKVCLVTTVCSTIGAGYFGTLGLQVSAGSKTLCEGTSDQEGGFIESGGGSTLGGSLTSGDNDISVGTGLFGIGGGYAAGYIRCRDISICF